jgi:hypothetical protein
VGSGSFVLGQRFDDAFNPFLGLIDDVAVYNHALTQEQIAVHFANSVRLNVSQSGSNLILTWPSGILQSAESVTGNYGPVSGATSPYTNAVGSSPLFFRLKLQ